MGETAMGWDDCNPVSDVTCNAQNYGTISQYIGPFGLDGQIDFVLYHGVSYRTFAYRANGLLHADFWVNWGQQKWGPNAIMTPYIGSQDTPRFVTFADYRGQDATHNRSVADNQWNNTANGPVDAEPYRRTRIALAWLLGLPGAPLLYYGDEYGQWGGSDPNNRAMWRSGSALNSDEKATLTFVQQLGIARQKTPAMRRGSYVQLVHDDDNTLVFGRLISPGQAAVVGLTRASSPQSKTFNATSLGFAPGTSLKDAMGGPSVTVGPGGQTTVNIPASGVAILAP